MEARVTGSPVMDDPSIWEFVKAVTDDWATLTTGGAMVALLVVWERFRRPVPRKLYAAIVICAVIVAFYQTWVDERREKYRVVAGS